jgi:hypothetical protein
MVEEKPSSAQHSDHEAGGPGEPPSDDELVDWGAGRQRRIKQWAQEQIKWEKSLPAGFPLKSNRQKRLARFADLKQAMQR